MRKLHLMTAMDRIVPAHRGVRMAGSSNKWAYFGSRFNHVSVFCHSVFQRYGFRSGQWQRPERVFRLLRIVLNTVNRHFYASLNTNRYFTPWLNINRFFTVPLNTTVNVLLKQIGNIKISTEYQKSVPVQRFKQAAQLHDRVSYHTTSLLQASKTQLRVSNLERLIQRIVKRRVRIDEQSFHHRKQHTFISQKSEILKPSLSVSKKFQPRMEEETSDTSMSRQHYNDAMETSSRTIMQRNYDDAEKRDSINVDQLTDQVVRAIDRRIIAQRERMGRS